MKDFKERYETLKNEVVVYLREIIMKVPKRKINGLGILVARDLYITSIEYDVHLGMILNYERFSEITQSPIIRHDVPRLLEVIDRIHAQQEKAKETLASLGL